MAKYDVTPLSTTLSNSAAAQINDNLNRISAALENTLSRDGTTPNQATSDYDLNNNDLLNAGLVDAETLLIGGVPAQPVDLANALKISNNLSELTPTASIARANINATSPEDINPRLDQSGLFRPYLSRDREKPWSLEEFGNYGTNLSDHTLLLQDAMDSDVTSIIVPQNKVFNAETTITLSNKKGLYGQVGSIFRLQRAGSYVQPLFYVADGADGSVLNGIEFDHNSELLTQASLGNAVAIAFLSGVPIMADDVSITNCRFLNGWDNGLSIGRFGIVGDGSPGSPYTADNTERAAPINYRVSDVYAYNCGVGDHTTGPLGRIGVGINILTGSRGMVSNSVAEFCHTGFATDFGGGAGAAFSNCISLRARENSSSNNGGIGFYLADGPTLLTNCQAMFGDRHGFEIPGEADGTILTGCLAYANKRHGYNMASSKIKLVGCDSTANSLDNTNLYDAYHFDPVFENVVDFHMIGCSSQGTDHRYGFRAETGSFGIDGEIIGGSFNGVTGDVSINGKNITAISKLGNTVKLNPYGGSTEVLGSWDNPFKYGSSYTFVDDVGRLRIKTGSAPSSITDGTVVGDQLTGGGSITIADDAVGTILPPANSGVIEFWAINAVNLFARVYYRANDGALNLGYKGSLTDLLPATTPVGTTGVDTHVTIASNGGNIYIENRSGGPRTFGYRISYV